MRKLVIAYLGALLIFTVSNAFSQSAGSSCHKDKSLSSVTVGPGVPLYSEARAYQWTPTQRVQKIELDIEAVDVQKQIIVLRHPFETKVYPIKIDPSIKLSADKKVMMRTPEVSDFSKGDIVKAKINLAENRVLEIKLMKSAKNQSESF